jgi:hypothetical protein
MDPIFGWRGMPAPSRGRKDVDAAYRKPEQLTLALERKIWPRVTAKLLLQQCKVEHRRRLWRGEHVASCVAVLGDPFKQWVTRFQGGQLGGEPPHDLMLDVLGVDADATALVTASMAAAPVDGSSVIPAPSDVARHGSGTQGAVDEACQ